MQGSPVITPKTKKGYLVATPAALEIFLILLIPVFLAAVHVYRLGVTSMTDYETNQLKTMMVRSVGTGTEMIYLEGKKAAAEGRYLDLGAAIEKVDAIDFASIGAGKDGEDGTRTTVDLEQANLQFWYLVIRGNGRILLVDSTAGTSRELTEEETLFIKCREAAEGNGGAQWVDDESQYCLFLQPLDGPVRYDGSPLLYNIAGAQIGMLVKGDLSFVDDSVRGRVTLYVLCLSAFLLIIITAMCVSIHRYLRVLRDMGWIMQRYRLQQYSDMLMEELRKRMAMVRRRSRDSELKDLVESFYAMICNLQDYRDTVESIKNQYEPFVPEELLCLFHREVALDVRPGSRAELDGAVLKVHFEPCRLGEDNPLCAAVCELIRSKGGVVIHIAKSGIEAVFPAAGNDADGRFEAEHAGQEAAEKIQSLSTDGTGVRTIATKVWCGTFCLRVIGCEKRMAIRLTEKGERNA